VLYHSIFTGVCTIFNLFEDPEADFFFEIHIEKLIKIL